VPLHLTFQLRDSYQTESGNQAVVGKNEKNQVLLRSLLIANNHFLESSIPPSAEFATGIGLPTAAYTGSARRSCRSDRTCMSCGYEALRLPRHAKHQQAAAELSSQRSYRCFEVVTVSALPRPPETTIFAPSQFWTRSTLAKLSPTRARLHRHSCTLETASTLALRLRLPRRQPVARYGD